MFPEGVEFFICDILHYDCLSGVYTGDVLVIVVVSNQLCKLPAAITKISRAIWSRLRAAGAGQVKRFPWGDPQGDAYANRGPNTLALCFLRCTTMKNRIISPWNTSFPTIAFCLCFKTSPSAHPFKWKKCLSCLWMNLQLKLIFIWKVSHLDSFWNRGKGNSEMVITRTILNSTSNRRGNHIKKSPEKTPLRSSCCLISNTFSRR